MAERAGEGFLGDVLGGGTVKTADLEGTDEPRIVSLVDLDEIRRRCGALVGWYGDSLAQGGSDLRESQLSLRDGAA